jgi:hypothetical protein
MIYDLYVHVFCNARNIKLHLEFLSYQLKINWLRCVGISILVSMFKTCMSVSVQYNLIGSV